MPAPIVAVLVYLPRFGVRRTLHFIIDTGSDFTALSPRDMWKILGAEDTAKLQDKIEAESVAGIITDIFLEKAILTFTHEDGKCSSYPIYIGIPSPTSENAPSPRY
jgi:hypothetical protein